MSKKTPTNRLRHLHEAKLRRYIVHQHFRIKHLKAQNELLESQLRRAFGTNHRIFKFFYKLALVCDGILSTVRILFSKRRNKK